MQASVPFGVMMGYIIASLITGFARGSDICYNVLCWRWPFLIEVALIAPLSLAIFFIPKELMSVKVIHGNSARKKQKLQLHLQSVLRSYSNSSFGDRKDRIRNNSAQMENSLSKSPNNAPNRYFLGSLSGNFSSQKTPQSNKADTELSARRNISFNNNNPEQFQNNAAVSGKSKTVKSLSTVVVIDGEKFPGPFPVFPKTNLDTTTVITSESLKDGSKDVQSSKFREPRTLVERESAQNSQKNITYCGLDIPNVSRLKSYDDLSIFESEKDTSEDNSENDIEPDKFQTPEKYGERSSRRRLRNQVRTWIRFSSFLNFSFLFQSHYILFPVVFNSNFDFILFYFEFCWIWTTI